MPKPKLTTLFFLSFFLMVAHSSFAQTDTAVSYQPDSSTHLLHVNAPVTPSETPTAAHDMNIIKTNLTALLLRNCSLQYERVLTRKISACIQIRTMPDWVLPFKNLIVNAIGDDDDTKKRIEDMRVNNFAITPEVRLYLSRKGYGRGFYFVPFYRYAPFTVTGLNITYTQDDGNDASVKMKGKLTSNTGGFVLGSQTFLSKRIVLDLWLLGPHFGSGKGSLSGNPLKPLSANEQNDLRSQLNDIDIPLTNKTVNVDANNAIMKLDGPWGGLRGGISLGVKF